MNDGLQSSVCAVCACHDTDEFMKVSPSKYRFVPALLWSVML